MQWKRCARACVRPWIGSRKAETPALTAPRWVFRPYMQVVGQYLQSLEEYPNPAGASLTKFGKQ